MSYKWAAVLAISFGSFNLGMDLGVIGISLPKLAEVFNVGPGTALWVSLVQPLLSSGLLLNLGRVGDIVGRERLCTFGFAISTIGLILCPLAPNIVILILFRMVMVIGQAMFMATANAIISDAFPLHERGKAIGISMGGVGAGALVGTVLGGFLLEHFAWPSIFYFRIPLAVIGTALGFFLLKNQPRHAEQGFDLRGAAALFAGLTSLVLTFNRGWELGWTSPLIVGLIVATLVLFFIFVTTERGVERPTVDLSLFRDRVFSMATSSAVIIFIALPTAMVLTPFYLVDGAGYSWDTAGLIMTTPGVLAFLVPPLSGLIRDRFRTSFIPTISAAIGLTGLFLLLGIGSDSSMTQIIVLLLLVSLAISLYSVPNSVAILGSVPQAKLGTASAMVPATRLVGVSIGSAIAMAVFSARKHTQATQLATQGYTLEAANRVGTVDGFHRAILVMIILG
ncbi:MAG: MFS transporter, partial [Chloroflexi bacterium]|nr:MFS transporter [Chloroflexota bacterium]